MVQDLFGKTAAEEGTIVSIISLFNAGGRFVWASSSDYIGRRNTYTLFFVVQVALFLVIPRFAAGGQWELFLEALFVVISMYGGGFSTIPAFLADMFGTDYVGAIHGAVLTAWSAAAVVGPYIVTKLSQSAAAALADSSRNVSRVHIYDFPLQILAGLLAVGFVLTLLIRPLKKEGV
jgi:MFS family permease